MEVLSGPEDNIADKLYTPGFKNCKTYRRQTAFSNLQFLSAGVDR